MENESNRSEARSEAARRSHRGANGRPTGRKANPIDVTGQWSRGAPSESPEEIHFHPVPLRARRDGWTEARQRAFIAALARCGSATAAARQVGKSVRGAYRLLGKPGAESFAEAWDRAVDMGREATLDCVIDRAMDGSWVPIVRRGRIVRMEFRYFDKLAIAVLSGKDQYLERAAAMGRGRRAMFVEAASLRRARDAEADKRVALLAEHDRLWEDAGRRLAEKQRVAREPRIRQL